MTHPLELGQALRNALEGMGLSEWRVEYDEPWFTVHMGPAVARFTSVALEDSARRGDAVRDFLRLHGNFWSGAGG